MNFLPGTDKHHAPPEFGIDANILKVRKIYLDDARDLEDNEIGGTCLWVQDASDLTANIDVRINDQLRDAMSFRKGTFIRGVPFSRLYISNTAQAGKWIVLFYAVEKNADIIEVVNSNESASDVNIVKPTTIDSFADVSLAAGAQTLIAAANPNRCNITIKNLATNPSAIRVGDNGAAAANGHELIPGEDIPLKGTGPIYGWNPGAAAQFVSVLEISD